MKDKIKEFLNIVSEHQKVFNIDVDMSDPDKVIQFSELTNSPKDNFLLPLFAINTKKIFIHKVLDCNSDVYIGIEEQTEEPEYR